MPGYGSLPFPGYQGRGVRHAEFQKTGCEMESVIEWLALAGQWSDIDCITDLAGGFDHALVVILFFLSSISHSDLLGFIFLTRLDSSYLIVLECIFLPVERLSTKSFQYSPWIAHSAATAKRSLVPSQLSCHMNC